MIDVRRLRVDLEGSKASLARKRVPPEEVQRAADLDSEYRRLAAAAEELRARVKVLSKQTADAMRSGARDLAEEARQESKRTGDELAGLEQKSSLVEAQLRDAMLRLPNFPAPEAPDGASEENNVVVRTVGYDPQRYGQHQRSPHWEIGAELQILDLERGAKISGSMFPLFHGQGTTLVRALCQLALDRNSDAFTEVRPPTLVRTPVLEAVAAAKFADDAYHLERDDLWAIPTAEVPLTSMRANEIVPEEELPVRLMAYTPCYRREAGAAGKDTRGLLRVHEFDKVEILALCRRDQAEALHAELLQRAIGSVAALGLPYRVLDICTGDLGQSHARSFDVEVYAPGCDMWLEVSSVSWFSDYQARPGRHPLPAVRGRTNADLRYIQRICTSGTQDMGSISGNLSPARRDYRTAECLHPYFRGSTSITGNVKS